MPQNKHSEIKKYLEIFLATLDYSLSRESKRFIADDEDHILFHFEHQRSEAMKFFNEKKLSRLKQKLASWLKGIPENDVAFEAYIKEKTGYEIGRFDDLKKRVENIIAQNEISNTKELDDIFSMIHYYDETSAGCEEIKKLTKMAEDYLKKPGVISKINKGGRSVVVNRKQEGDMIIESVVHYNGLKPKHFAFRQVNSPDGNRSVETSQWEDKHSATTGIRIIFPCTSGHVYLVKGMHPRITAQWKDNNTLLIETVKELNVIIQHSKVRSGEDVIKIEYHYF